MENSVIEVNTFLMIKSWTRITRPLLRPKTLPIKTVEISGIDGNYCLEHSMHIEGNEYFGTVWSADPYNFRYYRLDFEKMISSQLPIHAMEASYTFINAYLILIIRPSSQSIVFQGAKQMGKIDIKARSKACKNRAYIYGRWCQERGDDIYIIDIEDGLYHISWLDIRAGHYDKFTKIAIGIQDFYIDRNGGAGLLSMDGKVTLPRDKKVDINLIDAQKSWKIVIKSASRWIVSGEAEDRASIVSIDKSGRILSKIDIELTGNGLKNGAVTDPTFIDFIKSVIDRDNRSVMFVGERDGCWHLVSLSQRGKLILLQSNPTLAPKKITEKNQQILLSATKIANKSELIVSGYYWIKHISFRLK